MRRIISADNLVKKYGRIIALENVSFDIPDSVTALIGPNGSGKTTLINILMGLIKPDKGKVDVLGFNPWVQGRKVREVVSVIHEKPRFPSWYTGIEYLEYVASLYFLSSPRDKAYEAASMVGIAESLNRRLGEYSAGMVQRLALAQVLLGEPKVIILDEPTANLDPKARIEVMGLIGKLRRERGISFIISSHVLSELERVCNFIVLLHYGRLLLASEVSSLLPVHPVLEYRVVTSNNELLFEKAREVHLNNLELLEGYLVFRDDSIEGLTKLMQLIVKNQLTIEYIEPARSLFENIYLSVLGEKHLR